MSDPRRDPYLDVSALLASKNPRLARRLPRGLLRPLERLVHQEEVNDRLTALEAYRDFEFVDRALARLEIRVQMRGVARVPSTGRLTFCANHPTGGADGLAMLKLAGLARGAASVPVTDLLFSLPQLGDLFVPVDKYGSNYSAVQALETMYASEKPVVIFPAGRTSRPHRGLLREYPWSKSFVKKGRRHGRTIVPVHLSGRNSAFFYTVWRIRSFLRIRPIIEVILLVDEMLKKRGTTITMTVGEPIPPHRLDASRTDAEWADSLRLHTQSLGADPDARFPPDGGRR